MDSRKNSEPRNNDRESNSLMKKLADNIILGSERNDNTLEQLDLLETQTGGMDLLEQYRDDDETLLHLATKFHEDAIVVDRLVYICPNLLTMTRCGKYEGQTALHIAISKENYDAVSTMSTHPRKCHLLSIPATGKRFAHTIMMGELPLSVAAMTFNHDIVLELIDAGAKMAAQNSYGDTVFHSLVKFSSLHADKQDDVIGMMTVLNDKLAKRVCEKIENIQNFFYEETDPVAVWLLSNYEHLTPLQLAGKLGQIEIFNYILNLEGVYCILDGHDGLFDMNLYDITEIDGVAMQKWFSKKKQKKRSSRIAPQNTNTDKFDADVNKEQTRFNQLADPTKIESVLERICQIKVQQAFAFLPLPVVKSIIKEKWSRYRWYYLTWGFFHLVYMIMLTLYSIERTKIINLHLSQKNQTSSDTSEYITRYVEGITYINFVIPTLYFLFEIKRLIQKHYWYLSKIHHNGTYRLLLIIFSLTSFTDAIWYKIQPGNNYCLIISVLIGWWFLTFFFRAVKKFSFFTVMIQKIVVSDILRFSSIIILELISFTAMIYILFLHSNPPVEGFETFTTSMLTLFNLMLGLSDIGILNQAQEPWLAVGLFILFALLTYVLMVNALIAMMSETCAQVSSNKHTQWQLQRLSVILFIESTIFPFMMKCCGKPKFVKHFDIKQKTMIQEERYFLELDFLKTSYSKGVDILNRHRMAQTIKYADVHAPKPTYRQQLQNNALQQKQSTGLHQKQQNLSPYRQQLQSAVDFQPNIYRQQLENTGFQQEHSPCSQHSEDTSLQEQLLYKQQLENTGLQKQSLCREQLENTSSQSEQNPNKQHFQERHQRSEEPECSRVSQESNKSLTSDKKPLNVNKLNRKPSKHTWFNEIQPTSETIKDAKVLDIRTEQTMEQMKDANLLVTNTVQTKEPRINLSVASSSLEGDRNVKNIQNVRSSSKGGKKYKYRKRHAGTKQDMVDIDDDDDDDDYDVDDGDIATCGHSIKPVVDSDNQDSSKHYRPRKTTITDRQRKLFGLNHTKERIQITQPIIKPDITTIYIESGEG